MDALIVVDMQVGLLNGEPKHDLRRRHRTHQPARRKCPRTVRHGDLRAALQRRGRRFRTGHAGLGAAAGARSRAADIVIRKTLNDPFAGTDLAARLKEIAPDRVFVTGWATDLCVDATVRSAVSNHHNVVVVDRRPYLERPSPPRRGQRHPSPPLGLEPSHHPAIDQARAYGRTAALTGLPRRGLAPAATGRTLHRAVHRVRCQPNARIDAGSGSIHETAEQAAGWTDAAIVAVLPALASAQDFPAKPIKLIVPFPAGGPNDIIARVIGQRMSEITKQPVLIDNRGGQGGVLGTDAVAKAATRRLHHRDLERGRARHQPEHGKGRLRYAEGFRAGDAGRHRARDAGGRDQRPRQ